MKYISEKQFLEQPKEVQEVFMKWWKPEMYDLFFRDFGNSPNGYMIGIYKSYISDKETLKNATNNDSFKPLFTLQQLIEFIEENSKEVVEIEKGESYLKSIWKVACEVAREDK